MATFIHNEATCLNVIQEAGLPDAFYRVVDAGLEPVIEVGIGPRSSIFVILMPF